MIKKAIFILIALMLTACKEEPITTEQVSNFKLDYLFEKDGCKMYRFKDGGRYVYWSICPGTTSYEYRTSNGKSSTTHQLDAITSQNISDRDSAVDSKLLEMIEKLNNVKLEK